MLSFKRKNVSFKLDIYFIFVLFYSITIRFFNTTYTPTHSSAQKTELVPYQYTTTRRKIGSYPLLQDYKLCHLTGLLCSLPVTFVNKSKVWRRGLIIHHEWYIFHGVMQPIQWCGRARWLIDYEFPESFARRLSPTKHI